MPTEAELVRSTPVAEIARELVGRPQDLQDMLRRVTVTTPENTQILQISYTDSTPRRAQSGAQAFADGYLRFKQEFAHQGIEEDAATIQAEIDEIDSAMQELEIDMQGMEEGSPELAAAESERASLEDTRLGLRNQLVTTNTGSTDPGDVVQNAERPSVAISPKHQVDLALGVLLGIAAGMALASVRERMQDRIETPATLRNVLRAPTLGAIPDSPLLRGDLPRLVTIDERRSSPAEAYRALRANVLAAARDAKARTILVTSAMEGEGKTTTAVNLSVALAQVGKSVVLISADLRFPRVHVLLGIGNELGLGQVLQGSIELRDALVETPIPNLKVLPTGPVTADDEPVELLQSDRMVDVIRGCRQADVVIVDAPRSDRSRTVSCSSTSSMPSSWSRTPRRGPAHGSRRPAISWHRSAGTSSAASSTASRIHDPADVRLVQRPPSREPVRRCGPRARRTSRGGFQVIEDLVPRMTSSTRDTVSPVRKLRTAPVGRRRERTYPRMMSRRSSAR